MLPTDSTLSMKDEFDLSYPACMSLYVFGGSGSGKTWSVVEFLKNRHFYTKFPKNLKIYFFYDQDQELYTSLKKDNQITFLQQVPTLEQIKKLSPGDKDVLFVIDDVLYHMDSATLIHLGCVARHRKSSAIIISQSLYLNENRAGEGLRIFFNNCNFIWFFRCNRSGAQFMTFARQCSPLTHKQVLMAYLHATSTGRGFLVADFRPDTPSFLRFRSSFMHNEVQIAYVECDPELDEFSSGKRRNPPKTDEKQDDKICAIPLLSSS